MKMHSLNWKKIYKEMKKYKMKLILHIILLNSKMKTLPKLNKISLKLGSLMNNNFCFCNPNKLKLKFSKRI